MKKILAFILCLCILSGCLAPVCSADNTATATGEKCTCGYTPVIYVGPLGNTDIIADKGTDNERVLYHMTTDTTIKLIAKLIPSLFSLILTKNYDRFGDKLIAAVNEAFGPIGLDGDGNSAENVTIDMEWPENPSHKMGEQYYFHYDWRLDPMETAAELDKFIGKVKELTGHNKVSLRSSSMGGVITMSYFSIYGYDDIEAAVFQCCPILGTNMAGELLSRDVALNGRALLEYGIGAYPPSDTESVLLHILFNCLYYSGLIDAVIKLGDGILEHLSERVFEECLNQSFGTLLGLWSFVPDEYYTKAKSATLNESTQAGLIKKADNYHYNVQCKADGLLKGAVDAGVRIMIVAGCGIRSIPLLKTTMEWDSDCTVDTCYASAGATVALYGQTLPDGYKQKVNDGHNHISPLGTIDASTCILPEYTWFIKDMLHANCHDGISELYYKCLYGNENFTIWSDPIYPQFLQNDKPNLRVIPLGNYADGVTPPQIEDGSSFHDFYVKNIMPAEYKLLGFFDKLRGE